MEKANSIIFYSWQSDLKQNRGFIEQALKNAVKALRNDGSLQVEPVYDRDTSGVLGSPDIARTIFNKIKRADIFVCDVSIINKGAKRLTPNPNVVGEWGFALAALGEERIIMVMNTAYGKQEDLPFDMRARKTIGYYLSEVLETEDQKREVRKDLENRLKKDIRDILNALQPKVEIVSLAEQAMIAIKEDRRDQDALVRDYMTDLAKKIAAMEPAILVGSDQDYWTGQLIQAIKSSTSVVIEFAQLSKRIADMQADGAAKAMYREFSSIIALYDYPSDYQGLKSSYAHDLAKFLGHELFVIFFSFLIRNKCWKIIIELFDEGLYRPNTAYSTPLSFSYIAQNSWLLEEDHKLRSELNTRSVHACFLNERHTKSDLAQIVPIDKFMDADFFLFLRAQVQTDQPHRLPLWMPWSTLNMGQMPGYIQEATRKKNAEQLLKLLGVQDIATLRTRLGECAKSLNDGWGVGPMLPINYALRNFDFNAIGSQ